MQKLRSFRIGSDARGLTTVEYVIVLAMIAVLAVGLWKKFGTKVSGYLSGSTTAIDAAMPAAVKK
jgi:Flp pilus assembly pilin Flp